MSKHTIPVVEVRLEPHPNANSLSIVRIDGWQVVVKSAQWADKKLGIYIQPDYVVPTDRPEFAWLHKEGATKHRVRVQRLRGAVSMGFLIPAPPDAAAGDDFMEKLGIERWEPQLPGLSTMGEATKGPDIICPVYDVENYYGYPYALNDNEEVIISEKCHGSSGRFLYHNGTMFCGSRKEWKKEDAGNLWWRCIKDNQWIKEWCMLHADHVLYGELLGVQGGFPYGRKSNEVIFRAFDIWHQSNWLSFDHANLIITENNTYPERWVPILYSGRFNKEMAILLAEGQSTISGAGHIREGVVVQSVPDRIDAKCGRVKLKIVGNGYMKKS